MKSSYLLLLCGSLACVRSGEATRTPSDSAISGKSTASAAPNANSRKEFNGNANAERLVTEYVRRDANGDRLHSNSWFDSVVVEPDREPGYDSFTAIRSYQVGPTQVIGDTVVVAVVYDVIGLMEQSIKDDKTVGLRLVRRDTTERVAFPVVGSDGVWKIVSPQIDQHVLAKAILSNRSLPMLQPNDRSVLMGATVSRAVR